MMDEKNLTDAAQALLAGGGGIISALMRKDARNWKEALLEGLGATFLGFVVAKVCRASGIGEDMTIVFVALSGWIGAAQTSGVLQYALSKRLGIDLRQVREELKEESNHDS